MAQHSKKESPPFDNVVQHRENISFFKKIRGFFTNRKKKLVHPAPSQSEDGSAALSYPVHRIPVFEHSTAGVHSDSPPTPFEAWPEVEAPASPDREVETRLVKKSLGGGAADRGGRDEDLKFIVEEYFLSFTKTQLQDMEAGFYDRNVEKKLTNLCQQVCQLYVVGIRNNLEEVFSCCAPEYAACYQEPSYLNPPSNGLREIFDLTDQDIEDSVQAAVSQAFYELFCELNTIVIPDQVSDIVRSVTRGVTDALWYASVTSQDSDATDTCCQFEFCWKCMKTLQQFINALTFLSDSEQTVGQSQLVKQYNIRGIIECPSLKNPKKGLLWLSCYNRWQKPEEES